MIRILALLCCFAPHVAAAEEPSATEAPENVAAAEDVAASASRRPRAYRWGGIGLPLVGFNSLDGFGLGGGVEVFDRPRDATFGYRDKISVWTYWTVSGRHTNTFAQFEHRGRHHLLARVAYRGWYDMIYVGAGGADVTVDQPVERSTGNRVDGPSVLVGAEIQVPRVPFYVFTQLYGRHTFAEAAPGGLLDERRPLGLGRATYFDTAAGVAVQETDRWPMPHKGVRAEASFRAGGTVADGAFHPLVGIDVEAMGWWPVFSEWFVVGGRVLFDRTWGERPFWEQENVGGQFRDELGFEQMLTGYQRSRTRGDGVFAAMIELRPRLGYTLHPVWDLEASVSLYAESAFLWVGDDPGPHLPTIGVAPTMLWQGAVQFRGFASWGWLSDTPGGPRTPRLTLGVSTNGTL